jgi:hypothetical protein
MEDEGVFSDRYSTAIPLLADPEDIDPSSFVTKVTDISRAPDLKLSQGAKIKRFSAAGGNHRTQALELVVGKLTEKIENLKSRIQTVKDKKKPNKARLDKFRDELRGLKARVAGLGRWTVILYNESE